jgi:Rrf2 family protein
VLFNQTAVYALRAMAVLARLAPAEWIRSADLAERTDVPVHYLGKVMNRLVRAGLVRGQKGHGGGFSLSRAPRDITFAEILSAVGIDIRPDRCIFDWGRCNPDEPCPLHPTWSKLQQTLQEWSEDSVLEDTRGT